MVINMDKYITTTIDSMAVSQMLMCAILMGLLLFVFINKISNGEDPTEAFKKIHKYAIALVIIFIGLLFEIILF